MDDAEIVEAVTSGDYAVGRAMFEEYARAIDIDLCFQDFAAERVYVSMGFEPATPYYVNPLPNVNYFSLDLQRGR